jgi:hypothetical protein
MKFEIACENWDQKLDISTTIGYSITQIYFRLTNLSNEVHFFTQPYIYYNNSETYCVQIFKKTDSGYQYVCPYSWIYYSVIDESSISPPKAFILYPNVQVDIPCRKKLVWNIPEKGEYLLRGSITYSLGEGKGYAIQYSENYVTIMHN